MKKLRLYVACVVAFLLASTSSIPAVAASFSALWAGGFAQDVSADGTVVVGDLSGSAVRWQADGTITYISSGDAYGVSADGSMVVGRDSNNEAFLWTQSDGVVGLGDLPGGDFFSTALNISPDGVIVGQGNDDLGYEAIKWNGTTGPTGLGSLPGGERTGAAVDISADGSVIVGQSGTPNGIEAVMWTSTGIVGLGYLPGGGSGSGVQAVSADGSILVGVSDSAIASNREAFMWTSAGGMVGLGDLPGSPHPSFSFDSGATDVSADGSIIAGFGLSNLGREAFIWDETNGMQNLRELLINDYDLDLTGWILDTAKAISADGSVIVGWGIGPSGGTEAWRADLSPVPLPPALWLFGSGLLGLIGIAGKKAA